MLIRKFCVFFYLFNYFRYLIQQDSKVSVLTKQDIDAFLAQALSSQLTTEHNTQNLANLKLNQVDSRYAMFLFKYNFFFYLENKETSISPSLLPFHI